MTEVRSFLGFPNYCHKFIPKYAQIVKPINHLVSGENASKKKVLVDWTNECQVACKHLKCLCSQTPILAYVNYKKPFKWHTDASESSLGAVLYQKQDDDTEHVIAYASRILSKSEGNYDSYKLEFLALKRSITERFHEYLYGGHFEVYTDNNPLTYTDGSHLSWIFWEHEILSGLSVIWLIYIKLCKEKEKKSGKKSGLNGNLA